MCASRRKFALRVFLAAKLSHAERAGKERYRAIKVRNAKHGKEAEVRSGAFYGHFPSKDAAKAG
ncbi:MAG: hypothetical protein ACLPWS_14240 [Rhodomicrobium sp.]